MIQFTLPTSRRITQDWNQDFKTLNGKYYPNGFYASIGWKGHNGIDYGCPMNDNVEAVCDGVIEYVGPGNNHPLLTGGGNALLLRNDELGIRFEYLHLSQQNVYTGQRVSRGQVIAQSGNTGISSGPHLHLGAIPIRPNLNNGYRGRVDPTGWLYGPSNPDYAGTGLAAAGTTTPASEEDDDLNTDQNAALGAVFQRTNQAQGAGLIASQGDVNILIARLGNLEAVVLEALGKKSEPTATLVKGDQDSTVYAWDGGTGYRALGYDEFAALMATGAELRTVEQATIVGGN